jgi:hypothetical protein
VNEPSGKGRGVAVGIGGTGVLVSEMIVGVLGLGVVSMVGDASVGEGCSAGMSVRTGG